MLQSLHDMHYREDTIHMKTVIMTYSLRDCLLGGLLREERLSPLTSSIESLDRQLEVITADGASRPRQPIQSWLEGHVNRGNLVQEVLEWRSLESGEGLIAWRLVGAYCARSEPPLCCIIIMSRSAEDVFLHAARRDDISCSQKHNVSFRSRFSFCRQPALNSIGMQRTQATER